MKKLHFETIINASPEKLWHVMLDDATYREWASAFMPGSHYVGGWNKGDKIQFLSSFEGKLGGMTSEIAESRPYEFVSIHHLGVVQDGKEDTTSEEAKSWMSYENYTFQ